jgi:putative membrane protein
VSGAEGQTLIGELASQLSNNSGVRAFGQTLASDATDSLIAAQPALQAEGMSMSLPSTQDEQTYQQLASMSGQQLNIVFLTDVIQAEQTAVANAQAEVQNGQNAAVRAYAAAMIPIDQAHMEIAEQLLAQLQGSSGSST